MADEYSGQCAYGAIRYRIGTNIRQAVNCHCNMCRKHNGSVFSSYAVIPAGRFQVEDPDRKLGGYDYSERVRKHFCTHCGTPLFNTNTLYEKYRMIFLGTLDQAAQVVPNANIYCSSQLDWVKSIDEISNFPDEFNA